MRTGQCCDTLRSGDSAELGRLSSGAHAACCLGLPAMLGDSAASPITSSLAWQWCKSLEAFIFVGMR